MNKSIFFPLNDELHNICTQCYAYALSFSRDIGNVLGYLSSHWSWGPKKGPQTSLLGNNIVQTIIFNHRILFVKGFFTYLVFFLLHEAYYISKYLNCCLWMQEREVSMWQWWNVFKAYFYRVLIRSHLLQDATEVVPSDRYTKSDLWKNKLLCCYTFWKMNKLHQKSSQKITQ